MKDYSNYGNQINMMEWSAKKIFEIQLQSSEGKTVDIDDTKNVQVIIQEHTNPLNEDKEDRKFLVSNTIPVHTGSIVTIGEEKWLVINNVSPLDDNGVYYTTKIYPCNTTLKWVYPIDKTTIHEVYAIESNMSLYSIGINQGNYFTSEDGKRIVTTPLNDITKEIYVGQRFIIGQNVFNITEIYNKNGILELKMQQTEKIPNDDFVNRIADNSNSISAPTTSGGFW